MKRLMLAVLEDALRCIQTYIESPDPVHRKAFAEAETGFWTAKLRGRSRLGLSVTYSGSNPIACAMAYVSGERNYPTAQIPAAYRGTPCAKSAFGLAGLQAVELFRTATQPSNPVTPCERTVASSAWHSRGFAGTTQNLSRNSSR